MSARSTGANREDVPFGHETGVPPPRIEPVPPASSPALMKPMMISEKSAEKSQPQMVISDRTFERPPMTPPGGQSASSWEDSPKFIGESRGILTPSAPTRKVPSVSDSGGLKTPYIPAPAPKLVPPSVIVGPMTSSTSPKIMPRPPRSTGSPKNPVPTASPTPRSGSEATRPRLDTPPIIPGSNKTSGSNDVSTIQEKSEQAESSGDAKSPDAIGGKDSQKAPDGATKKKFPYEEE